MGVASYDAGRASPISPSVDRGSIDQKRRESLSGPGHPGQARPVSSSAVSKLSSTSLRREQVGNLGSLGYE